MPAWRIQEAKGANEIVKNILRIIGEDVIEFGHLVVVFPNSDLHASLDGIVGPWGLGVQIPSCSTNFQLSSLSCSLLQQSKTAKRNGKLHPGI